MSSNDPDGDSLTAGRREVTILVPCYNEGRAIAKVVADFRGAPPASELTVHSA